MKRHQALTSRAVAPSASKREPGKTGVKNTGPDNTSQVTSDTGISALQIGARSKEDLLCAFCRRVFREYSIFIFEYSPLLIVLTRELSFKHLINCLGGVIRTQGTMMYNESDQSDPQLRLWNKFPQNPSLACCFDAIHRSLLQRMLRSISKNVCLYLCHTFYAPSISVVSSPSWHFLECLRLPCLLSTYTVRYKKHIYIYIYIHIVHAIWTYNLIVDISCLLLLLAIRLFLWSSRIFVRLLYSLLSRISDFSPSRLNHVCLTALSSKQTQLSQSRALRLQLVMIFRYHSHLYVLIGIYIYT